MQDKNGITRRGFMRATAAFGGIVLLHGLPSGGGFRSAHAATSNVPVVDRLTITNVVDAYSDLLAKDEKRAMLEVKRGRGLIHAQHGLSLFVESQRGEEKKQVLFDFGWTPAALQNNMHLLQIDVATVEALVVSHGHLDHFGGLVQFLKEKRAAMPADLPLYVGGEDAFCARWLARPGGKRTSFGVLDRADLEAAKVRVVISEKPAVVVGHGFTSGIIERKSIEKVVPNTRVEVGKQGSAGCDPAVQHAAHFTAEELKGNFLFDYHWAEHTFAYHVKDRGLVVMIGCGHAGFINGIRQAQQASGVDKVHAVMGGFHLAPADQDYVATIVQTLKKDIKPDYVMPMHCSGAPFTYMVHREMPENLVTSFVGTRYVFGA